MSADNNMTEIAIASLLHDIGKIYERTNKTIELKDELFRYSHASYTSEFFNEWNGLNIPKLNTGKIEAIASYHHNPNDDPCHFIVQQADRYSAGADRRYKEDEEYITKGKSERPLVSIFSQLQLDTNIPQNNAQLNYYPLYSEKGLETGFPSKENKASQDKYQQLYKNLKEDLNKLHNCNRELVVDSLIAICRKYMSLVTSSAVSTERSDITLFDHSLTTAAISCAMYGWHSESEQFDISKIRDESINKFLLFKVDLSGIQDFILDLPKQNQKGIAKILRARSSYLSILMMGLSRLILEKLGLPSTNCLLNAGGNFTILAQNTQKTQKLISEFQSELDQWMLKTFNGNLYVNISKPIEFCGKDFSEHDNFKKISRRLSEEVDKSKKQRLKSVLQNDDKWNEDAQLLEIKYDKQGKNPLNEELKKLGRNLTYAKYIIFNKADTSTSDPFNIMGKLNFKVSEQPEIYDSTLMAVTANNENYKPGFALTNLANYVPKIKDEDIKSLNEENYEDMEIGQVLPFNHIAKKSEGKQALAVLKADVDRLGMLFSNGLISTNYTISRIATLSRMFDGFFSSYLNVLLKDKYPYIYTEYAGGDDLLLIGPWNRIMNLAIDMRQTFKQYTCNNPDLNISAGISLMHVGEPVTNALREAEKLLDTSKEKGRDKISLFGVTLDWDTYSKAIEQGKWLSKNVAKDKKSEFNPGFIYRLLQYYLMKYRVEQLKDTSDQKIPIKDAKWHSQLNYDMSRNIKSMDVRQEIEKMFSGEEIDNVKIATTYCLYSIRN